MLDEQAVARIKSYIDNYNVVLFMKGSPTQPKCGFSAKAVQVLKASGCDTFAHVDILEDTELRETLKEYAQWPTYPQLWIDGKLVGGCDIMIEMYQQNELQPMLSHATTSSDVIGACSIKSGG